MADLRTLFHELTRFETELWNAVDARLRADFDLPLSRFEPMLVISRRRQCRVYDIAEELSVTVGGTSKLVDRIEASGHCVRRPNPGDRRSSIIELTPQGKRLVTAAGRALDDELTTRLGSAVSPRAMAQFVKTLQALRAASLRVDEPAEAAPA
jgi:DNA-binding MarR family transcriptional regulator